LRAARADDLDAISDILLNYPSIASLSMQLVQQRRPAYIASFSVDHPWYSRLCTGGTKCVLRRRTRIVLRASAQERRMSTASYLYITYNTRVDNIV
jgi:hypothetical protein